MTELERFLGEKKLPGKLVFAKVWGSRSHDTHKPDSDWDFSGVYVDETRKVLGMNGPSQSFQNAEGAEKPDYAFHEAGKFCNLLLTGNPGIVEMLFTEKMCIESEHWLKLKNHRHLFLSKEVVKQYLGYSEGQLRRLKSDKYLHTTGGKYNEKWAYHLVRLLLDVERIVEGNFPVVWKEGDERQYLMTIRSGQVAQVEIENIASLKIEKINDKLKSCSLPKVGDKDFLENWLIDLRMGN